MLRKFICSGVFGCCLLSCLTSHAGEPGWNGTVIAQGSERERIEATPVIYRDYRPFHFYGNTARRMYYRGNPMLMPHDIVSGLQVLLRLE